MAVTSPVIERANPLGMHVVSKQRRKPKTGPDTPSTSLSSVARNGKGKAAANGEDGIHDSSSGEEAALEPKEAIRQQFQAFSAHRKTLNTLIRNNPALMSGTFSVLVKNPKVLDFDNKRSYFSRQLHKRKEGNQREHYGTISVNVRRDQTFYDSFLVVQRYSADAFKYGKLNVRFYGEEGVDAGGVTREWFEVLTKEMFNPNYAIFSACASDRLTYTPNRASYINPEHLQWLRFIGRIIGKAVYDGRLLDAYFTRSMYKHILGRPVDYRDMESIDPEYYNSLVWMLENDITDVLDQTFAIEADYFGEMQIIDLIENGRNVPVTQENKVEFVKLVTEFKLTKSIQAQIDAFLKGFYEIVPKELIQLFSDSELELLISGLPDIDVDEWRANTVYHNISSTSNSVTWFWRAVRSLDQTERAKLLQFCTGSSRVPLEGFQALQGVQGNTKFTITASHTENVLPSAHTCFNQIDLPNYSSYEDLRKMLMVAITEGSVGFAFA